MKGKLPRNNNADSGTKAHNDNRAYKVGRIRHNSWASKVLKSCDIIIFETGLVHIYKNQLHCPKLQRDKARKRKQYLVMCK